MSTLKPTPASSVHLGQVSEQAYLLAVQVRDLVNPEATDYTWDTAGRAAGTVHGYGNIAEEIRRCFDQLLRIHRSAATAAIIARRSEDYKARHARH